MADLHTKPRRAAIAKILRTRPVGTQEELRELVLSRGFSVTQATLSRDLQKLRARRVSLPDGGTQYELATPEDVQSSHAGANGANGASGAINGAGGPKRSGMVTSRLSPMRELVLGIKDGEAIVVMHTRPGAAPAIAALLDETRVPEIIGTLAGDDTIFIVPEKKTPARKLARKLEILFALERTS
jgi:transcriptional regulator of arginine metabolism